MARRNQVNLFIAFVSGFLASVFLGTTAFHPHVRSLTEAASSITGYSSLLGTSAQAYFDHDLDVYDSVDKIKHGQWQFVADNERVLNKVIECKRRANCRPNQEKVIVFVARWPSAAVYEGYGGGEGSWAKDMIRSMRRQGYTSILFARDGDNWNYAYELWKAHSDDILFFIGENTGMARKFYKSKELPDGIPAWKHIHFIPQPEIKGNVVGNEWTITLTKELTQALRNTTWIGKETECDFSDYVPLEKRKPHALILAKRLLYFYGWNPAWDPSWFERARNDLRKRFHPDFEFIGVFEDHVTPSELERFPNFKPEAPPGILNYGQVDARSYDRMLAESRVLVGIGSPTSSPSPWWALCKGTPFINPHAKVADNQDPNNRYAWKWAQHGPLMFEDPPNVYNAIRDDYDSFVNSLYAALTTSTPAYQDPEMTRESLDSRVKTQLLERDWYGMAKQRLEERLAGTVNPAQAGEIFML